MTTVRAGAAGDGPPAAPREPVRVGVDVGGSTVEAVAVDAAGGMLARAARPTVVGPLGVISSVAEAVALLGLRDRIGSIGIGVPGRIEHGRVFDAVNIGVTQLDVASRIAEWSGVPVRVDNDVNAAARGAFDGRKGTLAYLNLGTGVAAGVVIDGTVMTGARGAAGEIGHLSVDPDGPACACGQRGCIEAFAGGGAVRMAWGGDATHPAGEAFELAGRGDERAAEVVAGVAFGVAAAVRVLALSIDPERIVIGGGLSRLGGRLGQEVARSLRASAAGSAFLASLRLDERFELIAPGHPVGAIGAALAFP